MRLRLRESSIALFLHIRIAQVLVALVSPRRLRLSVWITRTALVAPASADSLSVRVAREAILAIGSSLSFVRIGRATLLAREI